MLRIGCHLSFSKGYMAMLNEALSIGADTFQFFTRNPRGGAIKPPDPKDAALFLEGAAEHGMGPFLAHAPYTINPCAAKPETLDFARRAMAEDLERMELIPGNLYNFHPGSHVGQGAEEGIRIIAETLNLVLKPEFTTTVLLETMAGKGTEVGRSFEELRAIIDATELSDKLGVCLDTCHIYDGGYDIVENLDGVLEEFDRIVGIDRLKAIHINDSKNPFASHKDRHEVIGGGSIGLEAMIRIINHPQLKNLPFFLETPNELEGYKEEIALLKSHWRA